MILRIKELREQAGMSKKGLSLLANVSQGKISEYETGKCIPRLDSAKRIADALRVSMDDLCKEEAM